jgi:HSP20 family protein
MSLIRRNTGLFPSFWNDVLTPDWFGGVDQHNQTLPAVNIREGESDFTLELAVPGQKREDFNVEVDNDVLTISMETRDEKTEKEGEFTRREFRYTSFKRARMASCALPCPKRRRHFQSQSALLRSASKRIMVGPPNGPHNGWFV